MIYPSESRHVWPSGLIRCRWVCWEDELQMNPWAANLHQRHINTLWKWLMIHSDAGLLTSTHTHTHTHTYVDRFSLESSSAHERPRRAPLLLHFPPSSSSTSHRWWWWWWWGCVTMATAGGGRRLHRWWAEASQPLSSVGGMCSHQPVWREQEAAVGGSAWDPALLPLFTASALQGVKNTTFKI